MTTDVRIRHWPALGGYYVVKGKNASPISGRFDTRAEAKAWLRAQREMRQGTVRFGVFHWRADNRYPREAAHQLYLREANAQRAADKMNAKNPNGNYVVRELRKENPVMRKSNPVPLAKGTKVKRKKAASKRKPSAAQLAARKRFAEMARSGEWKTATKRAARSRLSNKRATRSRQSNPRIRYGYDEIIAQTTQFAKLAKIAVNLEKHGGEKPMYQITSEGGSPMSQMLTALQMRDWLHGAIAAALAIRERR